MPENDNYNAEAIAVWKRIAGWWDERNGEGNDFQTELIMPVTDRLLALRPGEVVLDIACGNGSYSRRMAQAGASVVGIDVAETFIERARKRKPIGEIEYRVMDATDEQALLSLGEGRFDAATSSMAIMDFATITPLLKALKKLLKTEGRFVFSVPHPCFSSNRAHRTAELINDNGKVEQIFGIEIREYLKETVDLCSGILNQPEVQYMFHRPISKLLGECFSAGFVVDGFEEPAFEWRAAANAFSWEKRPDIPPAIVVRLKHALA